MAAAWYVLRKTMWRHRAPTATVAASLLVGFGFGAGMTFMYTQEQMQRIEAEQNAVMVLQRYFPRTGPGKAR